VRTNLGSVGDLASKEDLRLDDPALAHGEELGVAVPLTGLPQLVLVHDEHVVAGGRHPLELLVGESVAGRETPREVCCPADVVVLGAGEDEVLADEALGGGTVARQVTNEASLGPPSRWLALI